jgi:hypothetical protein
MPKKQASRVLVTWEDTWLPFAQETNEFLPGRWDADRRALSRMLWVYQSLPQAMDGETCRGFVALGDGRFTTPVTPADASEPIPIDSAHPAAAPPMWMVDLVLSQWVEETYTDRQIPLLEKRWPWPEACDLWRSYFGERPFEYIPKGIWVGQARLTLSRFGLLATPGTTQFFLHSLRPDVYAEIFPNHTPRPTRGAKVISVCVSRGVEGGGLGEIVSTVVFRSGWTTSDIRKRVNSLLGEHELWWRDQCELHVAPYDLRGGNGPTAISDGDGLSVDDDDFPFSYRQMTRSLDEFIRREEKRQF